MERKKTRNSVLADLRRALALMQEAQAHIQDAVGEAGSRVPTTAQGTGIVLAIHAQRLGKEIERIAAGGEVTR